MQRWDDKIVLTLYTGMIFSLADGNCYKQVESLTNMLVTFPGILKAEDIRPRACICSRRWFWYDFESQLTNKLRLLWRILKMTCLEQMVAIHLSFFPSYMRLSELWTSTLSFKPKQNCWTILIWVVRLRGLNFHITSSIFWFISSGNICFSSSVVQKNLEVGEVLAVDVPSIVAVSSTVNVQIKYNGPMRRVVFGVCFHMSASFDFSFHSS